MTTVLNTLLLIKSIHHYLILFAFTAEQLNMTEWKEYIGSDEQINEMCNALDGYSLKLANGKITDVAIGGPYRDEGYDTYLQQPITHFLICNPHPLADMIYQQARTGQPVWVRYEWRDSTGPNVETYSTTTPDWNLKAEYSFTEFKEDK